MELSYDIILPLPAEVGNNSYALYKYLSIYEW